MELLALSDIHGAGRMLAKIMDLSSQIDLILIAGDITDFGSEHELDALLSLLERFAGRIAAVPGNCDRQGARERLVERGISADGRLFETQGLLIAGSGGSVMRTGLTPYERHDGELASSLDLALSAVDGRAAAGSPLVVLTHNPPRCSGADNRHGRAVGSPALREILDSLEAPLWVCGHIHESRSIELVGKTLVVNPGALIDGHYALISLERDVIGWKANARLV
jgi:Icc-related predicted phosphoesterase